MPFILKYFCTIIFLVSWCCCIPIHLRVRDVRHSILISAEAWKWLMEGWPVGGSGLRNMSHYTATLQLSQGDAQIITLQYVSLAKTCWANIHTSCYKCCAQVLVVDLLDEREVTCTTLRCESSLTQVHSTTASWCSHVLTHNSVNNETYDWDNSSACKFKILASAIVW